MFAYILGIIAGVGTTVQGSVNGRIRERFLSPYLAALLSFIVSAMILAVITVVTAGDLILPLREVAAKPLWIWLGGVCGTAIMILNVLCIPRLGSARNFMLVCFTQIMTGLVIDTFGLFGSQAVGMTLKRTAGAVLVLAGIVLVNRIKKDTDAAPAEEVREDSPAKPGGTALYVVLALICGLACSVQIAVNGTLKEITGPAKATLISMCVGLLTTIVVILLITLVRGRGGIYDAPPAGSDEEPGLRRIRLRPWMISGGILATIIVGGNAVIAPVIGTGMVTILNLVGMIGMGLVVDAVGFLGIEKKPVTLAKVAGMILMTAGTALISL